VNELKAICEAFAENRGGGQRLVLATVVRTSGSVYRRPGARMLVRLDANGECSMTGAISGGCLERDVCESAREVLRGGASVVVKYDTTSDDDIVWGLGLGCDGSVEVLLEPLAPRVHPESPPSTVETHPVAFLARCLERRERGVMATVIETRGATGAHVGTRLLLNAGREEASDITDGELLQSVREDVRAAMREGRSSVRGYDLHAGHAGVFIETIEPPVPLVVFGAGADAVPVARLARELGWFVTVVDHRAAYATTARFPEAHELVVCRPEHVAERVRLDARTVTLVMTHNYEHDRAIIKTLLESPARYVGCRGPKRRTEKLLTELRDLDEGFAPTGEQLARVYAPV